MASSTTDAGKRTLSIGAVVARLRAEYPDLSISKVRYLEDEGLLQPARTKGGYRLFTLEDVGRLSEILRLQRDHFLPLTVIKEKMQGWSGGARIEIEPASSREAAPPKEQKARVSLAEALKRTAVGIDSVKTLENFGLIKLEKDGDTLVVTARDMLVFEIFSELSKFGIEPRHLRMYENQAQREALLFQQILAPRSRHKSVKLRRQSQEDLKELVEQTERLKRVLLDKALIEAKF